jgi:rRNA maturation RNase YbeY
MNTIFLYKAQKVTANAIEYNTSPYNELYRVMVHGILHLCGENDLSEKEKEEMKKAEDAALLRLNEYNIFI